MDVNLPEGSNEYEQYFSHREGVTDLIIKVEDTELHVNKGILMTASPVFERMLLSDFREKETNVVELPGKTLNGVMYFLKCLYPNVTVTFSGRYLINKCPFFWVP